MHFFLKGLGYCGPCDGIPPSTPTISPTTAGTTGPTAPGVPTVSPSGPQTSSPTVDPLEECDPVLPCGNNDSGVTMCIAGDAGKVEECIPVGSLVLFLHLYEFKF